MLLSEMYEKVSQETGVPLERVKEYDKQHWDLVKVALNNPMDKFDFDVLEVPFMGSFMVTKLKLRHTIRVVISRLRRLKDKQQRFPKVDKLKKDVDIYTLQLRKLWKLKQLCNY